MANEPISIDKQFENYLIRVKLDKNKISPTQYQETKRAFYAGASAMLVLFRGPIPDLPEDKAVIEMDKLWSEASFFWTVANM